MAHVEAAGFLQQLNNLIDSPALVAALITGLVGLTARAVQRRYQLRHQVRIDWSVLYDEPINQGPGTGPPDMWEIHSKGKEIEQGSLVVLDIRNSGGQYIATDDFDAPLSFIFPGREVVHFKVRDSEDLRLRIQQHAPNNLPENEPSKIVLPPLPLNPGTGFKLAVLLTGTNGVVEARGALAGGNIVAPGVEKKHLNDRYDRRDS